MTEISGYRENDNIIMNDNENLDDKDQKLLNNIYESFDDDDKDKLNIK